MSPYWAGLLFTCVIEWRHWWRCRTIWPKCPIRWPRLHSPSCSFILFIPIINYALKIHVFWPPVWAHCCLNMYWYIVTNTTFHRLQYKRKAYLSCGGYLQVTSMAVKYYHLGAPSCFFENIICLEENRLMNVRLGRIYNPMRMIRRDRKRSSS